MSDSTNHIILNGKLVPEDEARIPAVNSGLYYGAGAFETFLSEQGRIFKFNEHIERLRDGLEYLGAPMKGRIDGNALLDQIKKLLAKNNLLEKKAKIRIQASLAETDGYSGRMNSSFITILSSTPVKKQKSRLKLILSETSVIPSSARPTRLKLSNMLHYRHAFREAEQKSADDAVMLTNDGFVAETSIANIFWIKDEDVFTPSEECNILPGIMRNSLIDILKDDMQLEVKEGRFSMNELMEADSVWVSNSAIDFVPVVKIEDLSFEAGGSFFSGLRDHLSVYKEANMIDV